MTKRSDFEQVLKTPQSWGGCFSCVDKSERGRPAAIWLKMTGFECCSVRKLSEHHLLNLIWERASLAAFLFLFRPCQGLRGVASGGVMGRDRDDDPSWYRALGSLASGAPGPSKGVMLETIASMFKLSDRLRRRGGHSAASIKYSVVVKCRNIYIVGT